MKIPSHIRAQYVIRSFCLSLSPFSRLSRALQVIKTRYESHRYTYVHLKGLYKPLAPRIRHFLSHRQAGIYTCVQSNGMARPLKQPNICSRIRRFTQKLVHIFEKCFSKVKINTSRQSNHSFLRQSTAFENAHACINQNLYTAANAR